MEVIRDIFKNVISIENPLGLIGLIATIFFFIIRQILKQKIFPKLSQTLSSGLLKTIIDRLFVLSILVIIIAAFLYFYNNKKETPEYISGNIYWENTQGKSAENITVKAIQLGKTVKTDSYGAFEFPKVMESKTEYTFELSGSNINDTVITVIRDSVEELEHLKFIVFPKIVEGTKQPIKREVIAILNNERNKKIENIINVGNLRCSIKLTIDFDGRMEERTPSTYYYDKGNVIITCNSHEIDTIITLNKFGNNSPFTEHQLKVELEKRIIDSIKPILKNLNYNDYCN
jgi:hypothetical protein